MLCGVTATQGSNPCATAFRLVAPTDVGATSFYWAGSSELGARNLGPSGFCENFSILLDWVDVGPFRLLSVGLSSRPG